MSKIFDFLKYISKSTGIVFEKFFKIKNLFVKESSIDEKYIKNHYNLRDEIAKHLYQPPIGFLMEFKNKMMFLIHHSVSSPIQSQKIDSLKNNELATNVDQNTAYLELVSLYCSNETLTRVKKEKVTIDKILPRYTHTII